MASKQLWEDEEDLDLVSPDAPAETWLTSYGDLMTILLVFFVLLISASRISSIEFEKIKNAFKAPEAETQSITKIYDQLMKTVEEQNLSDLVKIENKDKSISVTLPGQMLFESGETKILPATEEALGEIAKVFKELPEYAHVAIEGHTDDNPVSTAAYPSNYHLSALRALSVLQLLEKHEGCKQNCEVRGFGEFKPKVDNRSSDGKIIAANQAQNRRVVIRIF